MGKKSGVNAVNAAPLLERISEDEGLAGGLAETEATALLAWMRAKVADLCIRAKDMTAAEAGYAKLAERVRAISKTAVAWCDDDDAAEAERWYRNLKFAAPLDRLPKDGAAAVKRLLEMEEARNA